MKRADLSEHDRQWLASVEQEFLGQTCTCDCYPDGRLKSGADTSKCPNPEHRRLEEELS